MLTKTVLALRSYLRGARCEVQTIWLKATPPRTQKNEIFSTNSRSAVKIDLGTFFSGKRSDFEFPVRISSDGCFRAPREGSPQITQTPLDSVKFSPTLSHTENELRSRSPQFVFMKINFHPTLKHQKEQ